MSALTIPQVRSWRPEALDSAATELGRASDVVDAQVGVLRSSLERALESAAGQWSVAAADSAADETRTGTRLASALDDARAVLSAGAVDLGTARRALLHRIDAAQDKGFTVSDDGTVTPPTVPPVMSTPEGAAAAATDRDERQQLLNDRAAQIAQGIGSALTTVGVVDGEIARRLGDVEIPQSLESAVKAYIDRALASGDLLESLGRVGAGAAALALTLKNAVKVFGKTSALARFLKASSAPITDYATFLKNLGAADDALEVFMKGQANGGFARFLMGSRAARIAGKAFLPLTVVTGLMDGVTGGGYDGSRGWATRGFGLAGAAGAGTLLASSAGLIALGPVGAGIAGAAVIGYGAWTAGSYVYDHWDDIVDFGSSAVSWTGDRLSDAAGAVSTATDWAGDKLSEAGDTLVDAGKSTVSTLSFGLLG